MLLIPQVASATIMQYLEIEDLARLSSDVFQGTVVGAETRWNASRDGIYTIVRIRVNETFKGGSKPSEIVTVTQAGGEKDGIRMDYSGRPEFSAGERVVLFTNRGKNNDYIVTGLKQGKLRVEGLEVKRDFSGVTLVARNGASGNFRTIQMKSSSLPMDELRTRLSRTR